MQKIFNDSPKRIIYDPPRPMMNEDIRHAVAVRFVQEHPSIQENRGIIELATDIAEMCERRYWLDGYHLAKNLEEHKNWSISAAVVSDLDGVGSLMHQALQAEEKRWAITHNIQPPFAIGTEVSCTHWNGYRGIITGISRQGAARYLVKMPNEANNCRAVVKFEDCWLEESMA